MEVNISVQGLKKTLTSITINSPIQARYISLAHPLLSCPLCYRA